MINQKQPQIVVGLLVTHQGFPLRHEIYKGTLLKDMMLDVVKQFRGTIPIVTVIVADAATLSQKT